MKKTICLFSGGIDSPVAAHLISKKYEVYPLFMRTIEGNEKIVIDILKKMKIKHLLVFPWKEILVHINKNLKNKKYQCIMCKKAMIKAAEIIAEKYKIDSITTGDSLAQKASQTLSNMRAISEGIKLPIFRPLLSMDKDEIIKISKEIGTYREKHLGNCEFVPEYPITNADFDYVKKEFKHLKLEAMIKKNLNKLESIKL